MSKKNSHRLIMGVSKLAHSFFMGSLSNLLVTRTGITSRMFEFQPDQISHFGVTCHLFSNMNISKTRIIGQSWSYIMCSINGIGKGCIRFWGSLDHNCGCHGNQNLPLTYYEENDIATFFRSFLLDLRQTYRYQKQA